MIRYALICSQDHEFDGWFSGSAAYDAQVAAGEVICPHCGTTQVEKALMAPNVTTSRRKVSAPRSEAAEPSSAGASAAAGSGSSAPQGKAQLAQTPEMTKLRELARRLREHVTQNADYVGDRFAEEARRIHYEEIEPRGIYGETTTKEAQELHEEGIEFHPLPVLPEDKN